MRTKENTGSLFLNDRKEKPTHKDYTGSCMIDGKQYWIAAWIHTAAAGDKYLSMDFKMKEDAVL